MTFAVEAPVQAVELLIRDAELLVVDGEREIPGGWLGVTGDRVTAVGAAGSEPEARTTVSAAGRPVTPGLINTHHHIDQNLTRSYAPAVNGSLFDWLTTLYPLWAGLDEEAAHVSAYVGMAELLMGGCTTGCRPVEYFEETGWMSDRSWVAHCIYPNDAELRRLAAAGVGVAHCPSSNMLIGGGTARVREMRELGLPVGIGCDGSASTDHASLWMETRAALLLGRYRGGPGAMTARDALGIATRGSARCLGRPDELGHLRPGACADLVVWDLHEVALAGAVSDPVEAWLRCGPARAWTTVVGGRILVDRGEPRLPGLADALRTHDGIARRMQEASQGMGPGDAARSYPTPRPPRFRRGPFPFRRSGVTHRATADALRAHDGIARRSRRARRARATRVMPDGRSTPARSRPIPVPTRPGGDASLYCVRPCGPGGSRRPWRPWRRRRW